MTQSQDFYPPTEPGEVETLTFDYANALGAGETISSVTIECAVIAGTDVATGHFIGGSLITVSPSSGLSASAVLQRVGNHKANCVYQYQCLALTAAGQALSLRANIKCEFVPAGSA